MTDAELIEKLRAKLEASHPFTFCCDSAPATFAELTDLLDRLAAANARAEDMQLSADDWMRGSIGKRAETAEARLAEARELLTTMGKDFETTRIAYAAAEARIATLTALLMEARGRGLIYWEPNTFRGHERKADMLARIDAALQTEGKAG